MAENDELFGRKFNDREELIQTARQNYAAKGYALSIKDSKKDKYVVLSCDRGGRYRNRRKTPIEARKKVTCTRLLNCPFEIRGKIKGGFWVLELKNNSHNHEPSEDMSGHPSSRYLTKEEISDIKRMSMVGIKPRQIITLLRQKNPHLQAVSRTIYNLKAKIQKDSLGGRTLIQALVEELKTGGFTITYAKDDSGQLTHVFLAHPKSIMLAKAFSNIFVMDCTCKTNKYGMSLLGIVGITSSNKSFYAGFSFLLHDKEEDYAWALQNFKKIMSLNSEPSVIVSNREHALIGAIETVFPKTIHLLCIWHIQKDIVARCKEYFEESDDCDVFLSMWNTVMNAETNEQFEESWSFLQLIYEEKKNVTEYLKNTWIPIKEKFVSVWTDKHRHLNNHASSKAEGAHSKLKKYLQVSTGNLRQLKNKLSVAIDNEFQEIKTQLESDKIRVPHKYNIPYFRELVFHVSIFALEKLHEEYEMASLGTMKPLCSGNFFATMGLPCAHMMGDWKDGFMALELIHSQWRIDTISLTDGDQSTMSNDDGEMKGLLDKLYESYQNWPAFQKLEVKKKISQILDEPLVMEPRIEAHKRKKLDVKKRNGSSSTRRDSSEFETVELVLSNKTHDTIGETSTS